MGELEAENHLIASGLFIEHTYLWCNQTITDLVKGLATPRQTHGEELVSMQLEYFTVVQYIPIEQRPLQVSLVLFTLLSTLAKLLSLFLC